ncbi:MAG: hypothetical protein AB1806_05750 [Acidobacteriota bacterium]
MALPDIAPILAKDFVTLGIDTDRMLGGKDLLATYNPKPGGIPWFVFIDGDGSAIIDSNDPDRGNVGFPAQDFEIAHFTVMLGKVRKRITHEEIEMLGRSLVAFRDVKLPGR